MVTYWQPIVIFCELVILQKLLWLQSSPFRRPPSSLGPILQQQQQQRRPRISIRSFYRRVISQRPTLSLIFVAGTHDLGSFFFLLDRNSSTGRGAQKKCSNGRRFLFEKPKLNQIGKIETALKFFGFYRILSNKLKLLPGISLHL